MPTDDPQIWENDAHIWGVDITYREKVVYLQYVIEHVETVFSQDKAIITQSKVHTASDIPATAKGRVKALQKLGVSDTWSGVTCLVSLAQSFCVNMQVLEAAT